MVVNRGQAVDASDIIRTVSMAIRRFGTGVVVGIGHRPRTSINRAYSQPRSRLECQATQPPPAQALSPSTGSSVDIVDNDGELDTKDHIEGYLELFNTVYKKKRMLSVNLDSTLELETISTGHRRLPFISICNHRLNSVNVGAKASQFNLLALACLYCERISVHPFVCGHVG